MELIDRTLRDFMNVDMPFGGKTMLLGGDFRQLLPVQVNATRSKLVNLSIKSSTLWSHFKVISLTENMRTLPEYLNTLNPSNFPPYELRLRANCIVMLLRNLSINEGLCNGTRMQVLELSNNLLRCRVLTGDKCV
ncbi:uncharacterized protein LOC122506401 [Leptopilina heterotoma]|uniref:uncharacterized protein LOC122506401 n=1 Tax=Leptopilina heterotoma TaxID=63436 RepID=UPI001CAA3974|nr:uncharacterized protein LOC122506401 [Leptopilina heterotoma]